MDKQQFWKIIGEMFEKEDPMEGLIETIAQLPNEEIADFAIHFQANFAKAYTPQLWGTVTIMLKGCSKEVFECFIGWLVAQGERFFNEVTKNPESLATILPKDYESEDVLLEEMLDIAMLAYTVKKSGHTDWDTEIWNEFHAIVEARGGLVQEKELQLSWKNEEDLQKMFPKLWTRFAKNPLK